MKVMEPLPPQAGTYVLLLALPKPRRIMIGKLGLRHFISGWYAYVGSAMGPGGVAARVGRHLKSGKKAHWHIDYLRRFAGLEGVYWSTGTQVREHEWASCLERAPFSGEPVKGFGCSDCKCVSHLFYYPRRPDQSLVLNRLNVQWTASADL